MKIWTTTLLAAVLAAACQPAAQDVQAPPATATAALPPPVTDLCVPAVSREIALSAPASKEKLTAQAIGADCTQALVLLTLHTADGKLMWSYAVRLSDTWAFIPDNDKPIDPKVAAARYLSETVAKATIETSNTAPDWKAGKERPEDPSGLFHATSYDRDSYLELRKKNTPMLCIEAHMGTGMCVIYDPASPDYASEFYTDQS